MIGEKIHFLFLLGLLNWEDGTLELIVAIFFLAQGENFSAEQSWEETNNERERRRQNL